MAHFAKIGVGNKVERVEVVSNDIATTEQAGVDFLNNLYGSRDVWKQTSYNTNGGEHLLGGTPFRKNYAGIGYKYDPQRDAFIPPKIYNSWTLNETTCLYDPPVERPQLTQEQIDNNIYYIWNEDNQTWDLKE
tara:strand:+ start:554 stop:952 length:399 start_codon:yes stop_codon:yes gene_type:complete